MSITALLVIMAIGLLITAFYSINNRDRYIQEYGQEMRALMEEAELIRKDLEAVLQNASLVSDGMIQKLDERLVRVEHFSAAPGRLVVEEPNLAPVKRARKKSKSPKLPFQLEDLRKAHPYLIVPRLAEEGFTVPEIAEMLDRGQGEIKLILDVQRKREVGG